MNTKEMACYISGISL